LQSAIDIKDIIDNCLSLSYLSNIYFFSKRFTNFEKDNFKHCINFIKRK